MSGLSILIPARNEEWLSNTILNILENIRGDTEVIAVLDGAWANPPIQDDERVTLIYHPKSVGQRAAINEAASISKSEYVMKVDAHCAFAEGFDVELMKECDDDWIVIPRMYNLHTFDWVCDVCGESWYMGPDPTSCPNKACDNTELFHKEVIFKPRKSRKTDFARFDSDLHFQYWGAYKRRKEAGGQIADLMCFVGAGWFLKRKFYWEIGGCDEGHGSWGQQGVEMACKGWLSGGRVVVNKNTWFSHMFRTRGGFSFPYPMSGSQQERARQYSRDLWRNSKWKKAVRPLSFILEKFWPIPGWEDKDLEEQKKRERECGRWT